MRTICILLLCGALLGCRHSAPVVVEYPLAEKIAKRDGTNYLGVYQGMIAEWDGWTNDFNGNPHPQGVMMFSATSGELLKWISAEDFTNIFVLRTKPEYP